MGLEFVLESSGEVDYTASLALRAPRAPFSLTHMSSRARRALRASLTQSHTHKQNIHAGISRCADYIPHPSAASSTHHSEAPERHVRQTESPSRLGFDFDHSNASILPRAHLSNQALWPQVSRAIWVDYKYQISHLQRFLVLVPLFPRYKVR